MKFGFSEHAPEIRTFLPSARAAATSGEPSLHSAVRADGALRTVRGKSQKSQEFANPQSDVTRELLSRGGTGVVRPHDKDEEV